MDQHPDQILWVNYEDLKQQPQIEIARVAAFLGIPASPTVVSATAQHSGFKAMQEKAGKFQRFYRKGEVAHGKGHFEGQLGDEFDALVDAEMKKKP